MKNDFAIKWMVRGIVGLILVIVIALVLLGKNGLINKEVEEYRDTHIEEINSQEQNKDNKNIPVGWMIKN